MGDIWKVDNELKRSRSMPLKALLIKETNVAWVAVFEHWLRN